MKTLVNRYLCILLEKVEGRISYVAVSVVILHIKNIESIYLLVPKGSTDLAENQLFFREILKRLTDL